jgi:hypothetical protein
MDKGSEVKVIKLFLIFVTCIPGNRAEVFYLLSSLLTQVEHYAKLLALPQNIRLGLKY